MTIHFVIMNEEATTNKYKNITHLYNNIELLTLIFERILIVATQKKKVIINSCYHHHHKKPHLVAHLGNRPFSQNLSDTLLFNFMIAIH